jgi:hypothetical protein
MPPGANLVSVLQAPFLEDVMDVGFDGPMAAPEESRDLFVLFADTDQGNDFLFPRGERLAEGVGRALILKSRCGRIDFRRAWRWDVLSRGQARCLSVETRRSEN